jgi:predicted transcriptional regulator YdeE
VLGDVVTTFENLPPGLVEFQIPAMKYAVFPIRPKNRFGWGVAIGSAKRYAYGTWLPNSEYEQGRVIDDFEYHDERSTRAKSPEIDLYICIRRREQPTQEAG